MPITVIASIGSRTADSVTVSTVTSTTVTGYTNAWSVVLSATVPSTTKIGDKLVTGANSYLITNIVSATITAVGDTGIAFSSTSTPSTGSATTARSYSSPDLWSSGAPASLVSKDWIWKGEVYKEGSGTNNEYVLGSQFVDVPITFNATSDATRYYIMTTASGQSFRDNANKLTNSLRYTPANGVAINIDGAYSNITGGAKTVISNLQIRSRSSTVSYFAGAASEGVTFNSCIISPQTNGGIIEACTLINTVFYSCNGFSNSSGIKLLSSTFYGTGGGPFVNATGGPVTIRNCTLFNYTSLNGGGTSVDAATSTYNVTDLASFGWTGTGNLVSKTAANQFQSTTASSEDFRVKAGADVINAGVRDQTYTSDLDIVGQARSTTTPTIGAWEFISVTYTYARPASDITTQWTPSTGTSHYALINEVTPNDADYIFATAAAQTDEVKLGSMTTPTAGSSVNINYRVQNLSGGASVTTSLYCNTTLIKADTARTANGTYTMTVSSAEWASVADWTNMRIRFVSA